MVDAIIVASMLKAVSEWFKEVIARQDELENREKRAVSAFLDALNETQIYLNQNTSRDIGREANLSRLWTRASDRVREFNGDLANRCKLKGEYWTNPNDWRKKDVEEARISIIEMAEIAGKILRESD